MDYQTREKQVSRAYGGGEDFLRLKDELGVDYVYIGENERNAYEVDEDWFRERYPLVYDQNNIRIYRVTENGSGS